VKGGERNQKYNNNSFWKIRFNPTGQYRCCSKVRKCLKCKSLWT